MEKYLQYIEVACGIVLTELLRTSGLLTLPTFMWVAKDQWVLMWIVVKLSGEITQYSIVGK